jgi:hypothetical protein
MEQRLTFGRIHLLEWLSEGDRRTGQEIFADVRSILGRAGVPIDVVLHRADSRPEFLRVLEQIDQDTRVSGRVPLLQIETHGDDDGIGPTRENGLAWPELMRALTPLNQTTGTYLTVILAACKGIWGIKMAQPIERAPFFGILGPNRNVMPGEVVRGMREFYRGVLELRDGAKAMSMLNNIVDPDKTTFGIFNCEQLFRDVWDGYLARCTDAAWIEARIDAAVAAAVPARSMSRGELADLRRLMRGRILDHSAHFEQSKRHFFMIDQFPTNAARFNLVLAPIDDGPSESPDEFD